jgi:cytochrome b561
MVADAEPLLHVGSGPSRYGLAAIALHWISVLFVVVVGVLGLLHDSWPRQTQGFWINVHAILGLLVWVLAIARISWRRRHPAPALPNDVGRLSHLMLVIPILGIVTFIWHGRAFNFGLFQVNFGIRSNRSIFHPTENIHGYLAYFLFALISVHAFAALWHHYIRHDGVLSRMWPASRGGRTDH